MDGGTIRRRCANNGSRDGFEEICFLPMNVRQRTGLIRMDLYELFRAALSLALCIVDSPGPEWVSVTLHGLG